MTKSFLTSTVLTSALLLAFTACGDDGDGGDALVCGQGTSEVDGMCVTTGGGLNCGEGTSEVGGECVPTGDDLVCGTGTYKVGNECTPFDPNDDQAPVTTLDPATTVFRDAVVDVRLITEPGARIFYTIDGSDPDTNSANEQENVLITGLALGPVTLKFYALDAVGNQEATQNITLERDIDAPAVVTDFLVTEESDGSVTVTWTNPSDADLSGVVIVREGLQTPLIDGVATTPSTVLYVGADSMVVDDPGEGFFNYRATTFDELFNYGSRTSATYDNPPVLVGSTGWTLRSNGDVLAGSTPTGVDVNIAFDGTTNFTVSATNNTTVTYQAPKMMFDNIVDGSFGQLLNGQTFARLGTGGVSLPPGETITGSITVSFTGTPDGNGIQSVTTDISFRNDPILVVGQDRRDMPLAFVDLAAFEEIGSMATDIHIPSGNSSGSSGMQGVVGKQGSRFIWSGNRSLATLRKIDTATWTTVAVTELNAASPNANLVGKPVFGPGGLLWVAFSTSGPARIGSSRTRTDSQNYLVAVDPDSMNEVRRIPVSIGGRLRETKLIPNTSTFVIANHTGGRLFLVDVSQGDANAVTVIENTDITPSRTVTLSPDGSTAYLAAQNRSNHNGNTGDVSIVDLNTSAVTLLPVKLGSNNIVQSSAIDDAGLIWFGNNSDFRVR